MNKIYLFFILVCCVQSYLLPFSYRLRLQFSLPLIKITARIDRPQMQRNWQGPHSTLKKKEETKFWGRLVKSVVFRKTEIESTFDYVIEAKYEYWIVHFMNGLLNQQTKFVSDGNAWPGLTVSLPRILVISRQACTFTEFYFTLLDLNNTFLIGRSSVVVSWEIFTHRLLIFMYIQPYS